MKKFLPCIFCSCFLVFAVRAQPCKEVVGYYPDWELYARNYLVTPATIDYSKYTIINYAFFKPNKDASIAGLDDYADGILLQGKLDVNGQHILGTSLIDLAHQHAVKVVLSIGGWDDSGNFPSVAADANKRATFAHNCILQINLNHFDGIDIDWEYPTYADHNGTPADKANFTLFLQQIRDSLSAYGNVHRQSMLLTAAVAASADQMQNIEWDHVNDILDFINLMTYDIHGDWDDNVNHNAPLYPPAQGDPTCDNSAVQTLLQTYHLPANKINLGIPFYGYAIKTNGPAALFAPSTHQVDNTTFPDDEGGTSYFAVINKMALFTYNWDNNSVVPYLTGNGSLNTFVSYDDKKSVAYKAKYIIDHDLHGAMMWEITGDYVETFSGSGVIAGTPLADTLNTVFCNNVSSVHSPSNNPSAEIFYPNPTSGILSVGFSGYAKNSSFQLLDTAGKILLTRKVTREIMKVDMKNFPAGIYYIQLLDDKNQKITTNKVIKQ